MAVAADDRFICSTALGRWQTNCYVVGDFSTGHAVVVDPGEHGETVVPDVCERLGVTVDAILLTHGHLDHLWAVPALARRFDVPVLLHAADRWLWDDPAAAFSAPATLLADEFGLTWDPPEAALTTIDDGQTVTFASTDFQVVHTPGHTPGHVVFRVAGAAQMQLAIDCAPDRLPGALVGERLAHEGVVLSGDLLFAGTIGRTDLARGSMPDMMDSLTRHVLTLDDDTVVLPGHGPTTTIARERATNPFLVDARARAQERGAAR